MKLRIPAGFCLAAGCVFSLLLQASGDDVLAREVSDSKQCSDVNGLTVQSGMSYTPGPDYCTVCKCEDGSPRFCRAVLCQPRPDCHSFRVGTTCCDFICLDDVLPNRPGGHPIGRLPDGTHYPAGGNGIIPSIHENGENSLGMRLAAAILTALMAFVLLLFLVHRLRQRRITAQQYVNAQDIACCHPAAYWHTSDQAALFLQSPHWKPPSCVIDAPPPYTEADAQRAAARAVFSNGVVTSMPPSAPPSYSGPVPPFTAPNGGATALPHHLEGASEDTSRDVLAPHMEARSTDSSGAATGGAHLPPASLGPLAVQLLPAASNSADLREQIQRQRRNLTDHNTRSLPRVSHPPPQGILQVSPGRVMERPPLHCTLARPPVSNALSAPTQQTAFARSQGPTQEENSCTEAVERRDDIPREEPLEMHLQCSSQARDASEDSGGPEHDEDDAGMQDCSAGSSSIVRKSVLKFEAAVAALEASDAHSGLSNSPGGVAAQCSPSRPTTAASRPSSSPHRKQDLSQAVVGTPEASHSPSQHTAFHFPAPSQPLHIAPHWECNFRGEAPAGGHVEDLQRRYPSYEATYSCTRQPLLPRDGDASSSPDSGCKPPRRRQHDGARPRQVQSGESHASKAKNVSSEVLHRALGDEDLEGTDRESFGWSDTGLRNADLATDLQSFRFSGRRTNASASWGRPEHPSTVNCSSGARNKI